VLVTTATDTVWSRGNPLLTYLAQDQGATPDPFGPITGAPDTTTMCSDRYGNLGGGDISYVGPCDTSLKADTNDGIDGVQNRVTLWVDGLYNAAGDAEMGEWLDPCPSGCFLGNSLSNFFMQFQSVAEQF